MKPSQPFQRRLVALTLFGALAGLSAFPAQAKSGAEPRSAPPVALPTKAGPGQTTAMALLDASARRYARAKTLDVRVRYKNEVLETARLRLRRPGDFHWQDEKGQTMTLYTKGNLWKQNDFGFYWRDTEPGDWKRDVNLPSLVAQDWLLPLLAGQNPLRVPPTPEMYPHTERWREVSVLNSQTVRGQKCRGVRRRLWVYDRDSRMWDYSSQDVWLRSDNSLWAVRGTSRTQTSEGNFVSPRTYMDVLSQQFNGRLSGDAFRFRLPAGTRDRRADAAPPFWSAQLRVGAPMPAWSASDENNKTVKGTDFKGRPLVMWFGFSDAEGNMPVATTLFQKWGRRGVKVVAVPMNSVGRDEVGDRWRSQFPFTVLHAPNDFSDPLVQRFGLQRVPFLLVVARNGTVAALNPSASALERALKGAVATSSAKR